MQAISAINSVTLSSATGTLTGSSSTNVADGDTVTIGTMVYRFKTSIAQLNDVHISGSGNSDTSLLNLIRAINGTGSPGTDYFTGTPVNTQVTAASSVTANAFAVTATAAGLYGNLIATTETSAVLSWGAATLAGGQTVTIVATASFQTFSQPPNQTTTAEYPANSNWSRAHRVIGDTCYQVIRNGANTVAFLLNAMAQIAVKLEVSLSWVPLVATQPSAASCAGNASATGTLTGSGSTNVADGETVTIGSQVYRFKTAIAQLNDVFITGSGNSDSSLLNLIRAINGTGSPGTDYFTGTPLNTLVTAASSVTSHAFAVTAKVAGLAGNAVATTKSSSVVSWGATTLASGSDNAGTSTVAAGVTESTVSYQWQYSTDSGVTWSSATGTVSGTAFTNGTTVTLTCTPTTRGLNGALLRCILTNASGSTNAVGSTSGALGVILTIA